MVGMLLSYALNQAIEKRTNQKEYLRVFKKYNSAKIRGDPDPNKRAQDENEECYDVSHVQNTNPLMSFDNNGEDDVPVTKKECRCTIDTKCFPNYYEELLPEIIQVDCIPDPKDESLKADWKNIHNAAVLLMTLVDRFMYLGDNNEDKLDADYDQYNDYGIVDMMSVQHRSNKLLLLYVLIYLTLNPGMDEAELLENFEDDEKLYAFLMDVQLPDFVGLVPLIRLFFMVHKEGMCLGTREYGQKTSLWGPDGNIQSDLENMIDWFLKRSFLEQVNSTGFNVYTAANVYFSANNITAFTVANLKAKATLRGEELSSTYSAESDGENELHENLNPADTEDLGVCSWQAFLMYVRRSFFITIFFGYPRVNKQDASESAHMAQKLRVQETQLAEVQSSAERATVCFLLQGSLYFGSFWLSHSKVCYEDDGFIDETYKNIVSVIILFFAFQYLTTISISEFYINTLSFMTDTKSWLQKGVMFQNIIINSLFTLSLIYSTAVILKSSGSFLDIILNSVAIFFVSELDDMMISDFDEDTLNERSVQALIFYMRDLSKKNKIGETSEHLTLEAVLTRLVAIGAIALILPYSIYVFFTGSAAENC